MKQYALLCWTLVICWGSLFGDVDSFRIEQIIVADALQARECKYQILNDLVGQYRRPFTVWDIGAAYQGRFSFRIARSYDATCVMLDPENPCKLTELCYRNADLDNIILLKKRPEINDLVRLSECEHADVVVAFDFMNGFFKKMWIKALPVLVHVGNFSIIEFQLEDTTVEDLLAVVDDAMRKKEGSPADVVAVYQLCMPESESLIVVMENNKRTLKRSQWKSSRRLDPEGYVIESTFDKKAMYKKLTDKTKTWLRGINLRTFRGFEGVYPSSKFLMDKLMLFKGLEHNDFNPCNLVLQGKELVPIDFHDPRRSANVERGFARCVKLFKELAA